MSISDGLQKLTERQASAGLTNKEVLEAFPDEAEELVPFHIKRLTRELKEYYRELRDVKNTGYVDPFIQVFKLRELEIMRKPKDKITHLQRLEAMKLIMTGKTPTVKDKDIDLDKAKKVSIVTLYTFKKAKQFGSRFTASCPFHIDKTPSFTIYPDNHFHCFSCLKHGSSIDFIMELHSISFIGAVKYLMEI